MTDLSDAFVSRNSFSKYLNQFELVRGINEQLVTSVLEGLFGFFSWHYLSVVGYHRESKASVHTRLSHVLRSRTRSCVTLVFARSMATFTSSIFLLAAIKALLMTIYCFSTVTSGSLRLAFPIFYVRPFISRFACLTTLVTLVWISATESR